MEGHRLGLPDGWAIVPLAEICSAITDGTHKTPNYVASGIRFISIANIKPFKPIDWDAYVRYITSKEHILLCNRVKPQYDDILFPRVGTLGYAKRIDFRDDISIFVGLGLARPIKEIVMPQFLEYFLNTMEVDLFSRKNAKGTGRMTLPLEASRVMPVKLPPLAEQRRIVAKVDALFSKLYKGVETLQTIRQQLRTYRQAVLKWAFEGKDWEKKPMKSISQVLGGGAFKSGDFLSNGKYQVIKIGNVRPGIIRLQEKPAFVNSVEGYEKYQLQDGDVVITLTGTRKKRDYGFTAIINHTNLLLNQRVAAIRFQDNYLPKFFMYYSWTRAFQDSFFADETGNVGQGNVGMKAITDTLVPYCSLDEQHTIVVAIESRLSVCDKLEQIVDENLAKATVLRQSILKKAFSGQLVPQDPNDEPAEKLLERIKQEKRSTNYANNTNKKRRKA